MSLHTRYMQLIRLSRELLPRPQNVGINRNIIAGTVPIHFLSGQITVSAVCLRKLSDVDM